MARVSVGVVTSVSRFVWLTIASLSSHVREGRASRILDGILCDDVVLLRQRRTCSQLVILKKSDMLKTLLTKTKTDYTFFS